MNSKSLLWMVGAVAVVMLAVGIGTLAQVPTPRHFSGLINDYSPETIAGKVVGPWEMHGKWSLDLKGNSDLADFSAEMTMELSDHPMEVAIANGVVTGRSYISLLRAELCRAKPDLALRWTDHCVLPFGAR